MDKLTEMLADRYPGAYRSLRMIYYLERVQYREEKNR